MVKRPVKLKYKIILIIMKKKYNKIKIYMIGDKTLYLY